MMKTRAAFLRLPVARFGEVDMVASGYTNPGPPDTICQLLEP